MNCNKCRCDTITDTCPACKHTGLVDISPHMYFDENTLGHRCRECKHVWRGGKDSDDAILRNFMEEQSTARIEFYGKMLNRGAFSPNDILEKENINSVND